jgi:uncharacterized protein YycO
MIKGWVYPQLELGTVATEYVKGECDEYIIPSSEEVHNIKSFYPITNINTNMERAILKTSLDSIKSKTKIKGFLIKQVTSVRDSNNNIIRTRITIDADKNFHKYLTHFENEESPSVPH